MLLRRSVVAFFAVGLLSVGLWGTSADAKWFGNNKKKADEAAAKQLETYQPPAPNAMDLYCDPIRQEVVALAQKPKLVRLFYEPRRSWLIHKHAQCKARLMEQENQYLKHVDIQQPPNLPRLNTNVAAPASGAGSAGNAAPAGNAATQTEPSKPSSEPGNTHADQP